jgi:hypothetical protein
VIAGLVAFFAAPEAQAYVEAPHSLGQIINLSSNIVLMQVEAVDREKNLIVYRKVRDLKGKHPTEVIKHNIGRAGFHEREWKIPMAWAEVGKPAIFFHNGSASETCTGMYWYQCYPGGEWWNQSHGEPFLLRSFAGRIDKLAAAVTEMLDNKEVIVPCMVDGNKDDLHLQRAKIQRCRASLKLNTYDQKRDFAGWGGEDFRRLNGMPGFTHYSGIARVDPDAQSISCLDIDGDGKLDLCLAGAGRIALLQNGGEAMSEVSIPGGNGGRSAVWADYNGDGLPDLLLATSQGPKLYTNLGKGVFRDDSHLLPKQPAWNLTCAAWIDQNGDGKPDILLGNGFHGLRLYRNMGQTDSKPALSMSDWQYIGPFANDGQRGFNIQYPPEHEIDLQKTYKGKNSQDVKWQPGKFNDGEVNNLALFQENTNAVVYLYREIESDRLRELPASFGSDDTLTVWLNGVKIISDPSYRACAPDQNLATLKLRQGKNKLLIKVCQGDGDWAFYFNVKTTLPPAVTWGFKDVSDEVGLGANGIGSSVKGDTLTVFDFAGDKRAGFLYGAGNGLLVRNTPEGFKLVENSGLSYKTGRVGPVVADFFGRGALDVLIPRNGTCQLFQNDGKGRFTDVSEKVGLTKFTGNFTCAAVGDVDNDGHLDIVLGCIGAPNRFLRNKGDGTFEDASEAIGLNQRVFNTQAVCLADLNNDGMLDMIFNNEGQESCVLLGNPEFAQAGKRTPVSLTVGGKTGVVGSTVRLLDMQGKLLASSYVSGGDGRGGQTPPLARFALTPGNYKVEVIASTGEKRDKAIQVATTPMRSVVE